MIINSNFSKSPVSESIIIKTINKKTLTKDSSLFYCNVILSTGKTKNLCLDQDQINQFSKKKTLTLKMDEYKAAKIFVNSICEPIFKIDLDDDQ